MQVRNFTIEYQAVRRHVAPDPEVASYPDHLDDIRMEQGFAAIEPYSWNSSLCSVFEQFADSVEW
ncbi:hypothetical protein MBENS4_4596 [Novosphingobium sp. MBES04]|nr:hypothetical protein MBENS4_4596 [Novosphingobium sp. MBES04]